MFQKEKENLHTGLPLGEVQTTATLLREWGQGHPKVGGPSANGIHKNSAQLCSQLHPKSEDLACLCRMSRPLYLPICLFIQQFLSLDCIQGTLTTLKGRIKDGSDSLFAI